jgi:hypothetical protein
MDKHTAFFGAFFPNLLCHWRPDTVTPLGPFSPRLPSPVHHTSLTLPISDTQRQRTPDMEVVGVGASVLAFVVVGLKSAKAAYEALSAIKDGNTHVAQARSSVQGLQSTLERLSRCRLVAEQQDEGLLKTVKECADNMKAFAAQLSGLDGPKHGAERQWNKVKIFLKEDDMKRLSAAVVGNTAALNFYLQVLER